MYLEVFLNTYMYGDAAAKHTKQGGAKIRQPGTASVFRGGSHQSLNFTHHQSWVGVRQWSLMCVCVCVGGGGGGRRVHDTSADLFHACLMGFSPQTGRLDPRTAERTSFLYGYMFPISVS